MLEGEEGEATLSAERGDRVDIGLPPHQLQKLKDLKNAGLPLIVILAGGSPIAIPEVQEIADAILFMWYPGEQGGAAVARVVFGDVSPSGKLPVTFPKSVEQLPPFDDYSMVGRTYRYMKEDPLYPFGFGLSYTTLEYGGGTVSSSSVKIGETVTATATITNKGESSLSEVAQCYLTDLEGSARTPNASLCGVKRVFIAAGQSVDVSFEIPASAMELVQDDGSSVIEPGEFRVTIGSCSPGKRGVALGAPEPAEMTFTVS
jgi:beta-glucosidase